MQKFNGSLIRQFPSLVTGNAATGVNVSVYIAGTTTLATLYATDNVAGATLANPLTTDSKGFYSFYAADGKYTLSYSNNFPEQNLQLVDVDAIRNDFDALETSNELFKTQQQAAYDDFVLSQGWDQVGTFAAGFTYESPNQVGQDADGNWWRWNGALPKIVTAGTNPASDSNYKLVGDGVLRSDLAAADSAALVGGVEAGDLGDRFRNYIWVTDYEHLVVASDWSPAFEAAISQAESLTPVASVFIPDGRSYNLSRPIITNKASLIGAAGKPVLQRTTNTTSGLPNLTSPSGSTNSVSAMDVDAVIVVNHPDAGYSRVRLIENLTLRYDFELGAARGAYGIFAPYWNSFVIRGVESVFVGTGIFGETHFMGLYDSCISTTVLKGFVLNDLGTSLTWLRCWSVECQEGFDIKGAVYSSMVSCAVDNATGSYSYRLTLCRGLSLSGCGSESAETTNLISIVGGRVVINGFDTFDNNPTFAMVNISSSARVVMNSCEFSDFTSLLGANQYNIQITDGSDLISNNCRFPQNGNTFNSYSGEATWVDTRDGISAYRSASESYSIGVGQKPTFAKSASNVSLPAGGTINTGLGRKAVNPMVTITRTATDSVPTVYPVITESLSTGVIKVRFYNDPQYTSQNFGTFNVDWVAF